MSIGLLVFVLLIQTTVFADVKYWNPDSLPNSQKDANSWTKVELSCPNTVLVFPEDSQTIWMLPDQMAKISMILPNNGQVVFNKDSTLYITPEFNHSAVPQCSDHQEVIDLPAPKSHLWFLAKNWRGSYSGNLAQPDIEKIPCHNDDVVFNDDANRVDLQEVSVLTLKTVTIQFQTASPQHFQAFLYTRPGQYMFENSDEVFVQEAKYNEMNPTCHLAQQELVHEIVCENTRCDHKPFCANPITPIGFCCPICGSSLLILIEEHVAFDLTRFMKRVEKFLHETKNGDVDFYASFVRKDRREIVVQLNLVERDYYSGKTADLMEAIKMNIVAKLYNRPFQSIYSGLPMNPYAQRHLFLHVFLPFLLVATVLLLAYHSSYGESTLLPIDLRALVSRWFSGRQFIFARFENTGNDEERIHIGSTLPSRVTYNEVEPEVFTDISTGLEMLGATSSVTNLTKDHIDEVVESIASEDIDLINVN